MIIQHFFDQDTSTLSYVVYDELTKDSVIIDPVLDFNYFSGEIHDHSARQLIQYIHERDLKVHFIIETHAHADHLTSSQLLKKYFPHSKVAISHRIKLVQDIFKVVFNLTDTRGGGLEFDFLIEDDQTFNAGSLVIHPIPTPGHTPACTSFLIGNNLFTGDTLFMPDYGTGRCDFPSGSALELFKSIKRLYELSDDTQVFVGHDYLPHGRELKFQTTIGESKKDNIQLNSTTTENEFIKFREARDSTLSVPRLLLPSLQVNITAGRLPKKEDNGVSYLKLPLKLNLSSVEF